MIHNSVRDDPQRLRMKVVVYGSTWSTISLRINLICRSKINIRIKLIHINLTDQLDLNDLRTTLTYTQHKCVPRMLQTTNQPPQQWTPTPSPSPSPNLNDHNEMKKIRQSTAHRREKTKKKNCVKMVGVVFKI